MKEETKIKGEEIERINYKDVRMDNWVLGYLTQEPLQIDWLAMKHLSDGNVQAAFYDHSPVYVGIPLTEQWLIDLGFKDSGTRIVGSNDQIEWKLEDGTVIEKSFGLLEYVLESDDWGSTQKSITLKSVHQLQNLHFALTETELTYNPKP